MLLMMIAGGSVARRDDGQHHAMAGKGTGGDSGPAPERDLDRTSAGVPTSFSKTRI